MTAAAFPFFVVRSLISTVVIAPLALIVAVAVAGLTFAGMPTSPGLHALSYGAGALVAFFAYGPGSGKARRQLNRVCAAAVRSPGLQAVALFGMCALAIAAVGTAVTAAAAFSPLGTPTGTLVHLRPSRECSATCAPGACRSGSEPVRFLSGCVSGHPSPRPVAVRSRESG